MNSAHFHNEVTVLKESLAELQRTLDIVQPNWLRETLNDYQDEKGLVSFSICLPIQAAIKILNGKTVLSRKEIENL